MVQSQVPIICDTNIWYNIATGVITNEDLADKLLVGTFITGMELCSTFHAINNFELLQSATKAFNSNTSLLCYEEPSEYMKGISGYESNALKWREVRFTLDKILEIDQLPNLSLARAHLQAFDDKVKEDNQRFIDIVLEHRSSIINRGNHKKRMAEVRSRAYNLEVSKELIQTIVYGLPLDWQALELFLNTFNEWFRQLSVQPSLTIIPNDWNDLMNLVYVQPDSLYWSRDEKKTKVFIRECGMGRYLLNA